MRNREAFILGNILILAFINFLYLVWFFWANSYLPPPFIYDKHDTYMDFYNTMYWSGQEGIYSIWQSVYPPINFLLLKIYRYIFVSDQISEIWDGFAIRSASNIIPLLFINVTCLIMAVAISFNRILDRKSIFVLLLIFLFSPAFLFAVERGNLVIICLPVLSFFIFTAGEIRRSLALALLINLKPYFFIFYIVQLVNIQTYQKNKDFLFLAPLFTFIIFLSTGLMLNQEFYLLPLNLLGFATNSSLISPTEALSFPSSISAFSYLSPLIVELRIHPVFGYLCKLMIFYYLVKTFILIYKKNMDINDLAIFSIIFLTNYSTSTGGYGLLYYIPVIAILYSKKQWILIAIIGLCMYVGLWDLIPLYQYSGGNIAVYLSGEVVNINPYISFGSIIRPASNFLILVLFFRNLEKRYL